MFIYLFISINAYVGSSAVGFICILLRENVYTCEAKKFEYSSISYYLFVFRKIRRRFAGIHKTYTRLVLSNYDGRVNKYERGRRVALISPYIWNSYY
jgi:hypothetical protein